MTSSGKLSENRPVRKPITERVREEVLDRDKPNATRQPFASRPMDHLPTGPGTRALRQAAVLQMQRTHGNAHVMRQLQPSIQRAEEEGAAAAAAPAGPSAISGSGGQVDTGGDGVEISGGRVKINSGMVEVSGVLQTDTIIATNVVGTNYTPGAGNIW